MVIPQELLSNPLNSAVCLARVQTCNDVVRTKVGLYLTNFYDVRYAEVRNVDFRLEREIQSLKRDK